MRTTTSYNRLPLLLAFVAIGSTGAFTSPKMMAAIRPVAVVPLLAESDPMAEAMKEVVEAPPASGDPMADAMEGMDDATREMMEKQRRANELREQEVFMKLSTGKHRCEACDWEYDEAKGDAMMIGGMIQPGTKFDDTPIDWRCPVCRASKDAFVEIVEEIPGFEVNQGYGFGTNSWSAGQKNAAIFGGLGLFFALFIGGYALS